MDNDPVLPDVACTLTLEALTDQARAWADLTALAVASAEIPGGSQSVYPATHAERIEELVGRERTCCGSWMDITIDRTADEVTLDITTTNPDGVATIRAMVASHR